MNFYLSCIVYEKLLKPRQSFRITLYKWQMLMWVVECVWNMMTHAQKPDFVFRRNGRVHLNRRGASVHSTTGSRGLRISGNNAGYTMFRGSVKGTGYPLNLPVSPSLPLLCVSVCHHISTGVHLQGMQKYSAAQQILLYINSVCTKI